MAADWPYRRCAHLHRTDCFYAGEWRASTPAPPCCSCVADEECNVKHGYRKGTVRPRSRGPLLNSHSPVRGGRPLQTTRVTAWDARRPRQAPHPAPAGLPAWPPDPGDACGSWAVTGQTCLRRQVQFSAVQKPTSSRFLLIQRWPSSTSCVMRPTRGRA